ncbi:MAG: serine/threonine protein kinase, partial [Planctomycetes bacterium]|nr:serine/threonine protein kinase [Planctomycetota bacterium]
MSQLADLDVTAGAESGLERLCRANPEHADQLRSVFAVMRQLHGTLPSSVGVADDTGASRVQSTATDELMGRLRRAPKLDAERYRFDGEIDRGGQGAVFRIHDRHLNRSLAMKMLLEREAAGAEPDTLDRRIGRQVLSRFLEEAQVTSQLSHPGIVPVHEVGLDDHGKVYFTMQLVSGRTAGAVFRDVRDGQHGWTVTRALEVVLKVCDTMAYAHARGVLHRDLKPANVMIGRFGEVYVMDWGLAKVVAEAEGTDDNAPVDSARRRDAGRGDSSSVASLAGQQLGTPSYMPPEQARGEPVDERADIYAVGAMLYELLAGRAPYTEPGIAKSARRILDEVVAGPPRRVEEIAKGVPAELVAIVEKAMARDRATRYGSTTELAADLRAFLDQRTVVAYRTGA